MNLLYGLLFALVVLIVAAIILFRRHKVKTGLEEREADRIKTERQLNAKKQAADAANIREQIEREQQLAARHAEEEKRRQIEKTTIREELNLSSDDELLDRLTAVLRRKKD